MDENGDWGPVFSRVITLVSSFNPRDLIITQGEFYWDNESPYTFLSFDGDFNSAIETLFSNNTYAPSDGLHTFNIRLMDENGDWGPVFSRVIYVSGVVSNNDCDCGDVNCDDTVDEEDAALIIDYLLGLENLSQQSLELANVNNDTAVDELDALEIINWLVGIVNELTCD